MFRTKQESLGLPPTQIQPCALLPRLPNFRRSKIGFILVDNPIGGARAAGASGLVPQRCCL